MSTVADAWDELGGRSFERDGSAYHGRDCTPLCKELAARSPLVRDRPPAVRCPWCGAEPGVACHVALRGGRRMPLRVAGRAHPSRLEVA